MIVVLVVVVESSVVLVLVLVELVVEVFVLMAESVVAAVCFSIDELFELSIYDLYWIFAF